MAATDRMIILVVYMLSSCHALAQHAVPIRAHRGIVTELSFSDDGQSLASTGNDGLKVWNLNRTGDGSYSVCSLKHDAVRFVGDNLMSTGAVGVAGWELETKQAAQFDRRSFNCMAVDSNSAFVTAGGRHGVMLIYRDQQKVNLVSTRRAVSKIAIASNGDAFAYVTESGWLHEHIALKGQLDTKAARRIQSDLVTYRDSDLIHARGNRLFSDERLIFTESSRITPICAGVSGKYLASGNEEGGVSIWTARHKRHVDLPNRIACMAISDKSQLLAAGDDRGSIFLIDVRSFRPLGCLYDFKCTRMDVALWIVETKEFESVIALPVGKTIYDGTVWISSVYRELRRERTRQQQMAYEYQQNQLYWQQVQAAISSYSALSTYSGYQTYQHSVPYWTTEMFVTYEIIYY